jgi:hypothetical protein
MARSLIRGALDVNVLLAFLFGVVFITAMLILAVKYPEPNEYQRWVFTIVVALAGAGIGAVIPGILKVDLPYVKAGGALAVFVIILINRQQVVETALNLVAARKDPTPVIQEFLSKVDSKKLDEAWNSLDSMAKQTVAADRASYDRAYMEGRYALGDVITRSNAVGADMLFNPSGYPPGTYKSVVYRTQFKDGCHQENVSVRADETNNWQVFGHGISINNIPCL